MKLSEVKDQLSKLEKIGFQLPGGEKVPGHFHITEIGKVEKNFIDCGGKIRKEEKISFQLWEANDYDHRLHPEKLVHIIELSEKQLELQDLEIEVEYQGKETIGKYDLEFDGELFQLKSKFTTCLAQDQCGVKPEKSNSKPRIKLSELQNSCAPGSGCC